MAQKEGCCLLGLDGPSVSPVLRPHWGLIHIPGQFKSHFEASCIQKKRL